uniref:Uncharacterized protein n=1 Tax=Arundo donax TaxID=35708 RepID=A0A0A9CRQ9_ARUDO
MHVLSVDKMITWDNKMHNINKEKRTSTKYGWWEWCGIKGQYHV